MSGEFRLRGAQSEDVDGICAIVNHYAVSGALLKRSREDVEKMLSDFVVCIDADGRVVGCSALHPYSAVLAEIRSIAVLPELHRHGIGGRLVDACLDKARAVGIGKVFVLTYSCRFFGRKGFAVVDKETLPDKIWKDCNACPRRDDCKETAMVLNVSV